MKNNSMYSPIDDMICNNTLLVYPDPLGVSVNVTCIAMYEGVKYSNVVILQSMLNLNMSMTRFIYQFQMVLHLM